MTAKPKTFSKFDIVHCVYNNKIFKAQLNGIENDGRFRLALVTQNGKALDYKTLELLMPKEFVFLNEDDAKKYIKEKKKEKNNG